MLGLLIAALVFGVGGATFAALAGVAAYRGGMFKAEDGLYSIPTGGGRMLAFTLLASLCTALAVILSTLAAVIA